MGTVYATSQGSWCGVAGVELLPPDEIWVTFYTGGPKEPHPDNKVVVSRSTDGGKNWSDPEVVVDPPGTLSAWDPGLWLDPAGKLWLFFNIGDHHFGTPYCARQFCHLLDKDRIRFSDPQELLPNVHNFGLNRPTVLPSADWALPIVRLDESDDSDDRWYYRRDHASGIALSKDQGHSWHASEAVSTPDRFCNENMVYVLDDGRVRMLSRTQTGRLWEAFSSDGGMRWQDVGPTNIPNPSSRFFVHKMSSGAIVLITNPSEDFRSRFDARDRLVLELSSDDGLTWSERCVIAEGRWIAYPDAVEDRSGGLHVVYDTGRDTVCHQYIGPEFLTR